ncbi:MAG: hypothetical protein K2N23_01950 [Clostridia bacterium]|nr:hypothetical protein [Clostridia bacterium]
MIVLCILYLIFEILMLAFLANKIRKCKQISLKDTVIYPFLMVVSALVLCTASAECLTPEKWYENVTYALSKVFDVIKLSADSKLMVALQNNDIFMLIDYVLLYVISALALFSLSLSLVKTLIKNILRIKIFNDEIDFIFGMNDDAKAYINNLTADERKKTCVVLEQTENKNYTTEKMYLDDSGIKYYVLPYGNEKDFAKTVSHLTSRKKKKYYLIGFFDTDRKIYDFVGFAQAYLKANNLYGKNVQFTVSSASGQTAFIKELIKGNPEGEVTNSRGKTVPLKDESRGNIRTFDKHEIIAYDFIWNNNFAKYFPKKLINDNCTIQDCDINLYVLGFGKVNQALLKDILVQTQFVTLKDGLLTPNRMNVTIYDKCEKLENVDFAYGLLKYDESNFKKENFLELPKCYSSQINYQFDTNTGEPNFINTIYDEIKQRGKKKPQINYFLISLGSDYENSLIAKRLKDSFSLLGENYTNTFFVRCRQSLTLPNNSFIYFGGDKAVLTYKNVVGDSIYKMAKIESCIYEGRPVTEENINLEWSTLSRIKQDSNLYSVASIPFKLSLLKIDDYSISEDEYFAKYDPNNERKNYVYSDKLAKAGEFSARDVLAFAEHERWNAFELSEGAMPMKIKNSLIIEKLEDGTEKATFKNKSDNEIYHLCITTSRGLNQYHDYVEEINKKYNLNETADVIVYDYDLMDNVLRHLKQLNR